MRANVNGTWKRPSRSVKVDGAWRQVAAGYVKVNGAWQRFIQPLVHQNNISLQQWTITQANNVQYERRSVVTSAKGSTPYLGSWNQSTIVVNGETWYLRGFETGADDFGWVGPWQWISLQFYGNRSPDSFAGPVYLNGVRAEFVDGSGYDATNDMCFLTARLERAVQFPINTAILLQF